MEGGSSSHRGLVATQEYLLQGSIMDEPCKILVNRLNGLCDNVETGSGAGPWDSFKDHEIVFNITKEGSQPVVLHARRALDHPDMPWHLRYVGQPELGDRSRFTLVRNCVDVDTSNNLVQFLEEMGFRQDYEFITEGYLFKKGRMKVTISKIYKMPHPGNLDQLERISNSCLVELSVVAPHGQDKIQEDMRNFAEQLKPLVHLEKIDPRRILIT